MKKGLLEWYIKEIECIIVNFDARSLHNSNFICTFAEQIEKIVLLTY